MKYTKEKLLGTKFKGEKEEIIKVQKILRDIYGFKCEELFNTHFLWIEYDEHFTKTTHNLEDGLYFFNNTTEKEINTKDFIKYHYSFKEQVLGGLK